MTCQTNSAAPQSKASQKVTPGQFINPPHTNTNLLPPSKLSKQHVHRITTDCHTDNGPWSSSESHCRGHYRARKIHRVIFNWGPHFPPGTDVPLQTGKCDFSPLWEIAVIFFDVNRIFMNWSAEFLCCRKLKIESENKTLFSMKSWYAAKLLNWGQEKNRRTTDSIRCPRVIRLS